VSQHLGPLFAIGEQKATQFLAQLAGRFDPEAASSYEAIFEAWGGDVRDRALDLGTGKLRPREFALDKKAMAGSGKHVFRSLDPTVYARVDYFDENAKITDAEKASCRAILKNLPVIFTFAPMNLLHYRARFEPRSTVTLTVWYQQYPYIDTRAPRSYQLAYVVHPASLWDSFGPIHLEVLVPQGADVRATMPLVAGGQAQQAAVPATKDGVRYEAHRATLTEKTGELLVALNAESWQQAVQRAKAKHLGALKAQPMRK
jgi:hypothetical protein